MQKAFSLTEVMVVIAITAMLTAIALPSYRNYVNKAKVAETITAAEPCKTYLIHRYVKTGALPTSIDCWEKTVTSTTIALNTNVNASYVKDGSTYYIKLSHNNIESASKYLYMKVDTSGNDLEFSCGIKSKATDGMDTKYLPKECQNTKL